MLQIEPFARPMIWQHFRMDTNDGKSGPVIMG
jgi:hypothetical protein